jgi:hypothetical protein
MSTVLSPLNFSDLAAASVYYEILGCDPGNLQPVYPEARFETTEDGAMAYYTVKANGSYARANGNHGEFVKMVRPDNGQEVFLHYSQVFCPTAAARKRMSTMAYILGVTYQSTYRQMATLNDLINEAAALNDAIRKFNNIFHSFATNATNYDSGLAKEMLQISPSLLRIYLDSGLQLPLNRICSGVIPQLYVCVDSFYKQVGMDSFEYFSWTTFFLGPNQTWVNLWRYETGYNTIDPPGHTFSECLQHSEIAGIMNDPERTRAQFSNAEQYTLGGNSSYYLKCSFNASGNMQYKYFFGFSGDLSKVNIYKPRGVDGVELAYNDTRTVNISDSCYSHTVPPDEVLDGSKIGYISRNEANGFLDQIRIAIGQRSNELGGISTMISMHNQTLQQNYAVASATTEASSEVQQKTARNIR